MGFLEYGALGLLAAVLWWLGDVLKTIVARQLTAFDRIVLALDKLVAKVEAMNVQQDSMANELTHVRKHLGKQNGHLSVAASEESDS